MGRSLPTDANRRVQPYVDRAEPSGEAVPIDAPIIVTFTEPMARATVWLDIQPRVGGGLTWIDPLTLRFQPIALAHATSYAVEVRGRSMRGVPLTGPAAWGFTTVEEPLAALASKQKAIGYGRVLPYLISVEPSGESVATSAAITLGFSEPMARATVFFAIHPQVEGNLTWTDDFTLRFQPIGMAHSVSYQFQVSGRSTRGVPLAGQKEWRFTTVGGPPVGIAPGPTFVRVPVLMYHYIRTNPDPRDRLGFSLSVTPANFAAQMDWLASNGYHTVTPQDVVAYLDGTRGLPTKPIVITFDDGYADFYTTALPILRSYDFTAVAYVVSGFIGWPGYMTAAQIVSAEGAGFEIGSHTASHVNLTSQSPAALAYQLSASKQALERLLGHPVLSFCYPSGKFGSREAAAVEAAGYQTATTTFSGSVRTLNSRYRWSRLRVSGGESLWEFAAAVQLDS